ncbi:MAG: TIR domain-containing protein [Desulfocapsaceae bacterium]|nr:TIR domain-containing protein [Desulfocapsaceae bacterium]
MNKKKPLKVFYSYSHEDKNYRKMLSDHLSLLRHSNEIEDWYDECVYPGMEWKPEITRHLDEAEIILLLISSSFMASKYCYSIEMNKAIQRHEAGEAIVIPVFIRPVDCDNAPFGKVQCLPSNGIPLSKWEDQDEGYHEISKGIRKAIEKYYSNKNLKEDSNKPLPESLPNTKASKIEKIVDKLFIEPISQNTHHPKHFTPIKVKEVSTSRTKNPLVSWIMVTSLTKHRWWKRLGEFLSENFPPDQIEFIILGAQDQDFSDIAYMEGKKIASAYAFLEGSEERWENVVFIDAHMKEFNLCKAINIASSLARGDILIFRDADCMILQYHFTKYLVTNLLKNKLGILSIPSIKNGQPFKPKDSDIVIKDKRYNGILLDSTVNGMSVATLKEIEKVVGGRNEHSPLLQYTNYCAKMAQLGFLMGYAVDNGFWLATADGESTITLTDINRDPSLIARKQISFSLINRFYDIKHDDIFYKIIKDRYKISLQEMDNESISKANVLYKNYAISQNIEPSLKKYDFKPWECLSHHKTEEYILESKNVAKKFFDPVIEKAKSFNIYYK